MNSNRRLLKKFVNRRYRDDFHELESAIDDVLKCEKNNGRIIEEDDEKLKEKYSWAFKSNTSCTVSKFKLQNFLKSGKQSGICQKCLKPGHTPNECKQSGYTCLNCHQVGHQKFNCRGGILKEDHNDHVDEDDAKSNKDAVKSNVSTCLQNLKLSELQKSSKCKKPICKKCLKTDHYTVECKQDDYTCSKCRQVGHKKSKCTVQFFTGLDKNEICKVDNKSSSTVVEPKLDNISSEDLRKNEICKVDNKSSSAMVEPGMENISSEEGDDVIEIIDDSDDKESAKLCNTTSKQEKSDSCVKCGQLGHNYKNCKVCWICRIPGHPRSKCPHKNEYESWLSQQRSRKSISSANAWQATQVHGVFPNYPNYIQNSYYSMPSTYWSDYHNQWTSYLMENSEIESRKSYPYDKREYQHSSKEEKINFPTSDKDKCYETTARGETRKEKRRHRRRGDRHSKHLNDVDTEGLEDRKRKLEKLIELTDVEANIPDPVVHINDDLEKKRHRLKKLLELEKESTCSNSETNVCDLELQESDTEIVENETTQSEVIVELDKNLDETKKRRREKKRRERWISKHSEYFDLC